MGKLIPTYAIVIPVNSPLISGNRIKMEYTARELEWGKISGKRFIAPVTCKAFLK